MIRFTPITANGVALFAIAAAVVWLAVSPAPAANTSPALTQTYRNDAYHFSLKLPADWNATEAHADSAPMDTISLTARTGGNIQITITPASDSGSNLTVGSILPDYPYMADAVTAPFVVAPGVIGFSVTSVPTTSNTPDQIWFAYDGSLYQLVAYDQAIDDLLPIAQTIALF